MSEGDDAGAPRKSEAAHGAPSVSEGDDAGAPSASEAAPAPSGASSRPEAPAPTAAEPPEDAPPEDEPYRERWFFDNPSLGRAIRYTFADKRLARAVFVNALLLVVALAAIQEAFGRGQLGLFSERISYGRIAFLGLVTVEAIVISLLAPLGAMFVFESERREECFDQVVASGVSPHRLLFGRFVATLAFVGVVLLSSLPFFATAIVLDGATLGQVLTAYALLAAYGVALASLGLACAVALDDAALPALVAVLAVVVVLVLGFSRGAQPEFAAWSPVRHAVLDQADIARDLRLGVYRPPTPYGLDVPVEALSLAFYGLAVLLGLGYAFVGPDVELTPGMDAFDSVTVSPKQEATRARRGVARALLRAVQLRFFYENMGPRAKALAPLVRALATALIFFAAHAAFLGAFWPDAVPKGFDAIARRTGFPYLAFCMGTLGLLAVSGGGARAALLSETPVLRLGPVRLDRYATLFLLFGFALAVPVALWYGVGSLAGWPDVVLDAAKARGLYLLAAGYALFTFFLSLTLAMVTTNPYSATGWTLIALFAANLTPAVWIPLFTGDVVGEGSTFLLDLSPLTAGYAVARPGETIPFTTYDPEGKPVPFFYEPDWRPFALFHAVVGLGLAVAGLVLSRRELRRARAARAPGDGPPSVLEATA